MPSNHLNLCLPLLLLALVFPSIRVFSNELALCIRWPKYWSFSFNISPSNEYSGWFPLGLTSLLSFLSSGLSRVFSSTTVWKHQFLGAQPSLWFNSHIRVWLLEKPWLWLYGPLSPKCFFLYTVVTRFFGNSVLYILTAIINTLLELFYTHDSLY